MGNFKQFINTIKQIGIGFLVLFLLILNNSCNSQVIETSKKDFQIIAYYAGNGNDLERYNWEQITQVIFSFCHLKGDQLSVDNAQDSLAIHNLVNLKKKYTDLKVLLSLGGWGGCKECSTVFSTQSGIENFVQSVNQLTKLYNTDGIDLDWEYPAIKGFPDHPYSVGDRPNFTKLVVALRKELGEKVLISFAAGGFENYFENAIEWDKVGPYIDYINLMSYDIVGGYSKVTGHHTPLYSNPNQQGSADFGVQYLKKLGVDSSKIILGAAFYGRSWKEVDSTNNGLYQSGVFKSFIPHHRFESTLNNENGFVFYRDSISEAPYAYSEKLNEFATFDDVISLAKKTNYALEQDLGGIMFWQLTDDYSNGALLSSIWKTKNQQKTAKKGEN
jgi:chitinase